MTSRRLIFSFTILFVTPSIAFGEAQCPRDAETVRYHPLERSQIAIDVIVNGLGPFEFMVDTGTQISTIEPALAEELDLKASGSIGVTDLFAHSRTSVAQLESMETNQHTVARPVVAIQELEQLQALNPHVRGILGLNFLAHFDILIDYGHKMICIDDRGEMRQSIHGEHIPMVAPGNGETDLAFTQPLLVSVYLSGNGSRETILNLDSGATVPILFAGRSEVPAWLADGHRVQGSAASGKQRAFSMMAPMEMRVGNQFLPHVIFLTPASAPHAPSNMYEDGLLPTTLFRRIFISYADRFVVFQP
jgi:hypothetical protein